MTACWYDEVSCNVHIEIKSQLLTSALHSSQDLGDVNDIPSCHCGTIAITSQENFPVCDTRTAQSIVPILICGINVLTCAGFACYGLYIVTGKRS